MASNRGQHPGGRWGVRSTGEYYASNLALVHLREGDSNGTWFAWSVVAGVRGPTLFPGRVKSSVVNRIWK